MELKTLQTVRDKSVRTAKSVRIVRPRRYFPWEVAARNFASLMGFVFVALMVSGFSLRYYAYSRLANARDLPEALGDFDTYLTRLMIAVLGASAAYLAYSAWKQARPLGRMIQLARELRRLDAGLDEPTTAQELDEEPGEWLYLERALIRIHRDLRLKTDALSRESQELAALIGAASDAILAVNRDGEPLFFNSQFAVSFGAKRSAGKALRLDETFRSPEILAAYQATLQTGERHSTAATVLVLRDPRPRHFSISVAPLRSEEGAQTYGAIGMFHDVTELKQAEQIRIEFVANASHELRTPLTSIKGYVDTLKSDAALGKFDEAPQFLEIVSRNVDRLMFLVGDLLDLSTIESGAELKRTDVDVREVTDSALRQLEGKRVDKRQTVAARFDVETVYADGARLEQVLLNLVHNAIKYIPEGKRIDVSWAQEADGRGVVLRVKDNGPGVPLEHQSRLFERFYRVDPGRSREQGGTGLGLSIVKHIMLKHGGDVRLESRAGTGAEFICRFPG